MHLYSIGDKEIEIVCYNCVAVEESEDKGKLYTIVWKFEITVNMCIVFQKTISFVIARKSQTHIITIYNNNV